ncbi:thiol-disulfide oxidoreductase ResA [Siminovitchia acidinfaciens]|uniref:Thiol-disulfide oxidoreductase ResA n=1 Tax=Siminovitchia acidinfaciens TaxID=2321395 RepID=A0A429XY89_9BACI|nr:thiol-disulfide oxidoreductase ResA [Siminovitchia acidinfaciens]RST73706.1 thiol-disulfide oxidoreductase ResA [Siminovitchia acidinfaciens]
MASKKKRRLIVRTVILTVMTAAVIYTLYANFTKDSRSKVSAGAMAPDFILEDLNGNQHQLSSYKGKGVFLNFWGTWCKPCEREMPYMNNLYKEYKDQGVEILAVNVGEPEYLVNKFVQKHDLVFPILKDKNKDIMNMYGVFNLPATLLVDPEGKVIKVEEGELTEGKIREMMESIKP